MKFMFMRKISVICLVLCLCFSAVSCSKEEVVETNLPYETQIFETTVEEEHQIADSVITNAFSKIRYQVGVMSITYGEIISECCPDYDGTFEKFNKGKDKYLTAAQISQYEKSEIGQYLENSYFVSIDGTIMQNPEIPYLVSSEQNILLMLLCFDENDEMVKYVTLQECREFGDCARLLVAASF